MQKRNGNIKGRKVMSGSLAGSISTEALRPSVERMLALVDTTDPAWPDTAAVLQEFKAAGVDLDENSVAIAVKLGRQRWEKAGRREEAAFAQPALAVAGGAIVYYIRRGAAIKIGTTVNPGRRFAMLLPDEILAFEPGGRTLEAARHRQFRHLRARGEHFRDEPELREHIARVRALYGEPDASWPSLTGAAPDRGKWQMPRPSARQTLTTAQAEAELGIKRVNVRQWVYTGRIAPVGRGEDGSDYFNRDQLVSLRDSARARLATRVFDHASG